jgi:hypothetical protein
MAALIAAGESPEAAMRAASESLDAAGGIRAAIIADGIIGKPAVPVSKDIVIGLIDTVRVMAEGAIGIGDDSLSWLSDALYGAGIHPASLPMSLVGDRPDDARELARRMGIGTGPLAERLGYATASEHHVDVGCVKEIPGGVRFPGRVRMSAFGTGLESVGDGVVAGGQVIAKDMAKLKRIGAGVIVNGDLDLSDCKLLREIGDGLTVLGTLSLSGCEAMDRFPAGARITGDVSLEDSGIEKRILAGKWFPPEGTDIRGSVVIRDRSGNIVMKSLRDLVNRYCEDDDL